MNYYKCITECETIDDLVCYIKSVMNDKGIEKLSSWHQICNVLGLDCYFANIGKDIINNGVVDFEDWYIEFKKRIRNLCIDENLTDEIAINVWLSYFEIDKNNYDSLSNIAKSKLCFLKRIFKGEKKLLACWIIPTVLSLFLYFSTYGMFFTIILFYTPAMFSEVSDCIQKGKDYNEGNYIKLPFILIGLTSTLYLVMSLFNGYIHHSKEILIYTMIIELVILLTIPIIGLNEDFFHTEYLKRKYKISK